MDPGHEDKRPRLSTGWPAGPSHLGLGVSLPHPGPPVTAPTHHSQPPLPPPTSSQYSPSPHLSHPPNPFPRSQEFPPPPHQQPPPPQHFDDRRQHEPERYPPAQDHRHHPPPSPAHQPYSTSGYQPAGRDSMVKRDPDEVKLPQIVRPNSNGPEQSPLPPPPTHGPPPSHMEERRHMSYDSGPAPQLYRHPSYPPPQTPLSHPGPPPTPYEQTQMYATPSMGPDGPYPITYTTGGGKRKSQRASQACESCRQLKAKCDESKPCKNCLEKSINCVYRDPAPKQQDKATQDILDAVQKMFQAERRELLAEISGLRSEFRELKNENRLGSVHGLTGRPATPAPPVLPPSHEFRDATQTTSPVQMQDVDETVASSPGDAPTNGVPDSEAAAKRMRILENEDERDEPPGEPIRPQEAPFPHDHTTPAGRLLKWPSIRDMVKPLMDAEGIKWMDVYPQRLEESRGQLPLFGRGEGSANRTAEREPTFEYTDIADDTSQAGDYPSPSANTDWGPIGGLSPPGGGLSSDLRAQVSRTDGTPEFDEKKVWQYVLQYKQHIQNMHPLIPPADLDAMVVSFLEEIGAKRSKAQAKFVSGQQEGPIQPSIDYDRKRKRSPAPHGPEAAPPAKKPKPQRSIKHALVLLVLALGKICGWREGKLPDVPEKEPAPSHDSPVVRNGHITSPNQGSPPLSALSQSPGQAGLPSPKDHERSAASRRSSMQASGMQAPTSAASPAPPKKNYEIIPGLEYFAYATDILGNQFGSYKLSFIHAHILASLYYGQLGRVTPSFRHIRFACQAIVDKLQPSMDRLSKAMPNKLDGEVLSQTDNKYLVAFWSCCQLESDILAELNLLPSGILQYEKLLPYPNGVVMVNQLGFPEPVVYSYSAQLYLRKRLNEISGRLYNPEKKLRAEDKQNILSDIENTVFENKDIWAGMYTFDVNDPPAEDILNARVRAKFWGANVITYRPSIQEVLGWSHRQAHPEQYAEDGLQPGSDRAHEWPPVNNNDVRTKQRPHHIVVDNARKGINAVMKSTEAFHGLHDKRFIITNIFGTAHAQWGNLVTLAAAYQDPILGEFIPESDILRLFRKTIEFFEVVAQDSSSLAVDLRILKGLLRRLPRKDQPRYGPPPAGQPNGIAFVSNGQTPHSASGPSPHTNTPSDLGQSTPMEF